MIKTFYTKTDATVLGNSSDNESIIFSLDLSSLKNKVVKSIIIRDDNIISGGNGSVSGFDLDFVGLFNKKISSTADVTDSLSDNKLTFDRYIANPGFQQLPADSRLSGYNSNNTVDLLEVNFDKIDSGFGGFLSLGESGSIVFNLNQPIVLDDSSYLVLADYSPQSKDHAYVTFSDQYVLSGNKSYTLIGGAGNDNIDLSDSTLYVGNDVIWGCLGDDTIKGGLGFNYIYAYDGNDNIDTGMGFDVIYTGNGNDSVNFVVNGYQHLSWIDGGSGDDTLYLPSSLTLVTDYPVVCGDDGYIITLTDNIKYYYVLVKNFEYINYQDYSFLIADFWKNYYPSFFIDVKENYDYVQTGKTTKLVRNDYAFTFVKEDGSLLVWGNIQNGGNATSVKYLTDVVAVYSNQYAYVAVRSDGSLFAWGNPLYGGDISGVISKFSSSLLLTSIYSTATAFAALYSDGSVMTWGLNSGGGDSSGVSGLINGSIPVTAIYSTKGGAFAAVREDGSVVTWGNQLAGGNSTSVAQALNGDIDVLSIYSTDTAFAALRSDGSLVTWGYSPSGGDSTNVSSLLDGNALSIIDVVATQSSFAAILSDKTLITWGDALYGGKSNEIQDYLLTTGLSIRKVYANDYAFTAILSDGSLVAWGGEVNHLFGGSLFLVSDKVDGNVDIINIFSASRSFAALRADGTLVSWGIDISQDDLIKLETLNNTIQTSSIKIIDVVANDAAFAALLSDGSVFTWGSQNHGGDSSAYTSALDGVTKKVLSIHATSKAFAVIYDDQSVFTWGDSAFGGGATTYLTNAIDIAYIADIRSESYLVESLMIENFTGSANSDYWVVSDSYGSYDGGVGNDFLVLPGSVVDYSVTYLDTGKYVIKKNKDIDQPFLICAKNIEQLNFDDMTLDLSINSKTSGVSDVTLKQLIQLYVGFFNRIPESTGLSYWVDQLSTGISMQSIADQFYQAGVSLGVYQANMSQSNFIIKIYENVLGRVGDSAPSLDEVFYWQNYLSTSNHTKGLMVIQMLNDAYSYFSADPNVGWVVDLLDNKASFAHWYAIDQGLSYLDVQKNITQGNALASAVTATSISEALDLVGISPVYRFAVDDFLC